MEISKGKTKLFLAIFLIICFIFSGSVFASENFKLNLSEEYKAWEDLSTEEKNTTIMPRTFDIDVPDNILNKYIKESKSKRIPSLLTQILKKNKYFCKNYAKIIAK